MDVCFITRGGRHEFLESRVPAAPGAVVDTQGRELARHDGIAHFTVGQRRGLGVAAGERRYVVDLDVTTSTVTIGGTEDLRRDEIVLRDLRWVSPAAAESGSGPRVQVQAPRHAGRRATRRACASWKTGRPVARGQVVAFYDGETLLGGGLAA